MPKGNSIAVDDKKWQADSDCHTLIEYGEIKKDKARMKAAVKVAKEKMAALKEVYNA